MALSAISRFLKPRTQGRVPSVHPSSGNPGFQPTFFEVEIVAHNRTGLNLGSVVISSSAIGPRWERRKDAGCTAKTGRRRGWKLCHCKLGFRDAHPISCTHKLETLTRFKKCLLNFAFSSNISSPIHRDNLFPLFFPMLSGVCTLFCLLLWWRPTAPTNQGCLSRI